MAGLSIGKFQVLGSLGEGAHSKILHVRRSADSKQYALKVVPISGSKDAKFLEQAQREFAVGQLLDHPNLIKIHSLELQRNWLFQVRTAHILIEFVNGKTLDLHRKFPMPQLLRIFASIAAGLAHMHRRGVCHADLKPNNIMLSKTGTVKILDYGLAWVKGQQKNRVQGTPEYMAPEQAREAMVNEQTDIYNFGATMYRLVTWRHPPNPMAKAGDLRLDERSWSQLLKPVQDCNAEAPPQLAKLIHRCIAFQAKRRPTRVAEVKEELETLADKFGSDEEFHEQ